MLDKDLDWDNLTWRFWHDCFVFLFHGAMRRHSVYLDLRYKPPKPNCHECYDDTPLELAGLRPGARG